MKIKLAIIAGLLTILLLALMIPMVVVAEEEGKIIFVNVNNSEAGDGSKVNPYKSIKDALEFIKKDESNELNYVVKIAKGTYELDETLNIDMSSKKKDAKVTFKAQKDGEYPIISGGKKIEGKWTDEGNGIYSIELNRDKKLRSLYVNGTRCYMTSKKVKGLGGLGKYTITEGEYDWAWVSGSAKSQVQVLANLIPVNTINQDNIELTTASEWNTTIVCAESIAQSGKNAVISLQMPYAALAQTVGWGNEFGFDDTIEISNVFEWLDEPGEFYFDKTNHKLYYMPREGEKLDKADVVVPNLECLVNIQGENIENKVTNVSFENLIFENTDWNLYELDGSYGRACNQANAVLNAFGNVPSKPEKWHDNIYRTYEMGPAAIQIESAQSITLKNIIVRHTGNEGITLVNNTEDITITGCGIYDTAASAIVVGNPQHMFIGDKGSDIGAFSDKEKYGVDEEALCKNTTIEKSYFFEICNLFPGCPGVTVFAADTLLYKDNYMLNVPYCGLSVGWGWWNMNGDADSSTPNHKSECLINIEVLNNKFENSMLTLNDGGAIYTLGIFKNSKVEGNYIKGIGTPGNGNYKIRGIHQDEGTRNLTGSNNVIDIKDGYAAIDLGNWGRKGNNTWTKIYSSSNSYSTEKNLEEGSSCELIYLEDAKWNKDAKAIIKAAGKYDSKVDKMIKGEKFSTMMLVGIIAVGVIVLFGIGIGTYLFIKKRQPKVVS